MSEGLYDLLNEYGGNDFYPFHMPGHKRNPQSGRMQELYRMDITEIDGFDDLHRPESVIRDAQLRAAQLYHSEETYFLVNGSTAGILSAVSAIACGEKRLIIARNCHKAVYHAAFLNHMRLHYIYPEYHEEFDLAGEIMAAQVENAISELLEQEGTDHLHAAEKIAGVVITSPTYDGISSNVREIADLVHHYKVPLIVDQAHGAHFGLHPAYPKNAVCQGADLVIHSVHKTLPAPTQTALLHRNGNLVDGEKLRRYLRIYQSSSPSYPLMAGIDEAVSTAQKEGRERLERLLHYRNDLLREIRDCRYIRVCMDTEPGKLVISVKDSPITGRQLYHELRENYHLQMEMASGTYVLGILSMMDTEEGMKRLSAAIREIDRKLCYHFTGENRYSRPAEIGLCPLDFGHRPQKDLELWEAFDADADVVELQEAQGRTAAEMISLYPPGIPFLVPGERIDEEIIYRIESYRKHGYPIQGIEGNRIRVTAAGK